jgi:oxygen-independent coproporphyrinogen-3 oxidase
LGYWQGGDWLGIGPGAHSHFSGLRRWNLAHPATWAAAVTAGLDPAAGTEQVDDAGRRREAIMLGLRLREGISDSLLDDIGRSAAVAAVQEGLLLRSADQWVLTDRGRLLADGIVARLWG